jgi:CRISPR/Cas system-associated exonuclease Cas4 (RecB family)
MAAPVKQFTSVSYSRWRDYVRCPLFAKLKHLDKLPEPDSPAMARGSAIGKLSEHYLTGVIKELPIELSLFKTQYTYLRGLKGRNIFVEMSWGFTKDWQPCSSTDWARCHLRVKMDIAFIDGQPMLFPIDAKTGRYRPDDIESYLHQLSLYSVAGMVQHPQVIGASSRLWFLDSGAEYPQCEGEEIFYPAKDVPLLKRDWEHKFKPMLEATKFNPTPNTKCKWCPYRKEANGPCPY